MMGWTLNLRQAAENLREIFRHVEYLNTRERERLQDEVQRLRTELDAPFRCVVQATGIDSEGSSKTLGGEVFLRRGDKQQIRMSSMSLLRSIVVEVVQGPGLLDAVYIGRECQSPELAQRMLRCECSSALEPGMLLQADVVLTMPPRGA